MINLFPVSHCAGVYGRGLCYCDDRHPAGFGGPAVLLPAQVRQEADQEAAATTAGREGGKYGERGLEARTPFGIGK